MGLIYDPNDSRNLLSALNANINTADEMISGLKRGSKHLVSALGNKTLSGAAYTAGKGMFSQVVIPTISKASQALDKLRSEVKQYEGFAADAGVELLDEDKLNTQLQSLQAQQVALTGQIGFYNQQALLHLDNSELMFTYKTFGQELSSYMGVTAESIQSIQNKLRQLYQFNTNVSGLFRDIEATFANLSTVISAIGSGKFNSSGKFSMTCSDKDLVRINKFLSRKSKSGIDSKWNGKTNSNRSFGINVKKTSKEFEVPQKVLESWIKKQTKQQFKDYLKTISEAAIFDANIEKYAKAGDLLLKADKFIGYTKILTNIQKKYEETGDIYVGLEYAAVSFSFGKLTGVFSPALQYMVDKSYEKGSWNQQFQESLETREALYKNMTCLKVSQIRYSTICGGNK